jgi:hypothetical protein
VNKVEGSFVVMGKVFECFLKKTEKENVGSRKS